jgi:hypothetical protein
VGSPASHYSVFPADARAKAGIVDGLVRLSVGVERVGDLQADREQARRLAPAFCLTEDASVFYDRRIIKTSRGTGPLKLEQPVA